MASRSHAHQLHQLLRQEAATPTFAMWVRPLPQSEGSPTTTAATSSHTVKDWEPPRTPPPAKLESTHRCEFDGENLGIGRSLIRDLPNEERAETRRILQCPWTTCKGGEDLTHAIPLAFDLLWQLEGPAAACIQAFSMRPAAQGFAGFLRLLYYRVRYGSSDLPDIAVDRLRDGADSALRHLRNSSRIDDWTASPVLKDAVSTWCDAIREMARVCSLRRFVNHGPEAASTAENKATPTTKEPPRMTVDEYLKGCPLCRTPAARLKIASLGIGNRAIDCPVCGRFGVSEEAIDELMLLRQAPLALLSGWCRERAIRGQAEPYICTSDYLVEKPGCFRISEIVARLAPRDPASMLDRSLMNLAALSGSAGQSVQIDHDAHGMFFAADTKGAMFFLTEMDKRGWLSRFDRVIPGSLTLSVDGWSRAAELRRRASSGDAPAVPPDGVDDTPVPVRPEDTVAPRPKAFICYAKENSAKAEEVFDFLIAAGAAPWMDKRSLVHGDPWESEIRRAVEESHAFVVLLAPGFDSVGYRQKEVHLALEAAMLRPPGKGYIIPFIAAPCALPDLPGWCKPIHAGADLGRPTTLDELAKALEKHSGMRLAPLVAAPESVPRKPVAVPLGPEEAELLRAASAATEDTGGALCLMVSGQHGRWVRAGAQDFLFPEDPLRTLAYVEALMRLVKVGLARHESDSLYVLTRREQPTEQSKPDPDGEKPRPAGGFRFSEAAELAERLWKECEHGTNGDEVGRQAQGLLELIQTEGKVRAEIADAIPYDQVGALSASLGQIRGFFARGWSPGNLRRLVVPFQTMARALRSRRT